MKNLLLSVQAVAQGIYSGKETPLRNDSLRGVLLLELT